MLGLLVPPEVVGWYGVATKLFTTTMFLPAILATAWLPRLVRSFTSGGFGDLAVAARVPLEGVLVLSVPVCVGTPANNSYFGEGLVDALDAVS